MWVPQQELKNKKHKDIGDDVHIGEPVMPFRSIDNSAVIDKTAFDSDNGNLKVKKIRRLIEHGIYKADIVRYIPGTLDQVFSGMDRDNKSHWTCWHNAQGQREPTIWTDTGQKP